MVQHDTSVQYITAVRCAGGGGGLHTNFIEFYTFVSGTITSLLRTTVLQALFPYMPHVRRFFSIQTGLITVKGKNVDSASTLR